MGFLSVFVFMKLCCFSMVLAQQQYERLAPNNCSITNPSTTVLGYSLNGVNSNCRAYLIFRSQYPYNTVSSISALLASDPFQISQVNSVSVTATFETNQLVTVPVTCSSAGEFYQVNLHYVIQNENSYFWVANNTFQGLSTCHALQNQNSNITGNLSGGIRILVPLRCACPTKNQSDSGIKYLLTYLVTWQDTVRTISAIFGVDTGMTLEANGLSWQDYGIYPFTTLLVPLNYTPNRQFIVLPQPPPPAPAPLLFLPPIASLENGSNRTWVYILVGLLAGSALAFLCGTLFYCKFFKKRKGNSDSATILDNLDVLSQEKKLEEETQKVLEDIGSFAQSLKVFNFHELQSATDDFSSSCWINGSVYRGKINGDFAAIKKMNGDVSKEINLLNKINHSNLVCLWGVCFSDDQCYLVYEYAVNGDLSDWIYTKNNNGKFLNWTQRIQIALDVSTGLNYLHCYISPPYVHKDINSSNILLDIDFKAKITNFGSANSAPDNLENGLVSTKLDVYAFGVLVLEILSGKHAADLYGEENINLHDVLNGEDLKNFIDPSMEGSYPLELAFLMVKLIHSCLHIDPSRRPVMGEIVQSLSKILNNSLTFQGTEV